MESFKLHPLVLVNVSDHYTRLKAQLQAGEEPSRVMGCLLGTQSGREIEIFNSFEVKTATTDGVPIFDNDYLRQKQEQYKKVFPNFEVVGWYSTGAEVSNVDMQIHKSITELNESPVYMLFNPKLEAAGKDLPITLYESVVHVVDGIPSTKFEAAEYTIETVEAERISVDHVAKIMPSGQSGATSQHVAHLQGVHSAVRMLSGRVGAILQHIKDMEAGKVPMNHSLLRQVASLVQQLPTMDSAQFREDFLAEYNDTLLMTYLATITKGTAEMNEFADRFNLAYDKHSRRRGF